MAEDKQKNDPANEAESEIEENPDTPQDPPKSNKLIKMGLFIGGPILLIAIIAAVLYFMGIFGGHKEAAKAPAENNIEAEHKELQDLEKVTSYAIPSMLINLKGEGKRSHFLKITLELEIEKTEEADKIMEALQSRIVDQFQIYLRELTVEDLQGSAGMQRLREELVDRANAITKPLKVYNVLFKEMLVQ